MSNPAKIGDDGADTLSLVKVQLTLGMSDWGKPGDWVAVSDPADPGVCWTCSEPGSGAVTRCAAVRCCCSTVAAVATELAAMLGPELGTLGAFVKPPGGSLTAGISTGNLSQSHFET